MLVQQNGPQEPQGIVLASGDTFQEDNSDVEVGPYMDHADVAGDSQAYPVALLPFLALAFAHAIDTFVSVAPFAFASLSLRLASAA